MFAVIHSEGLARILLESVWGVLVSDTTSHDGGPEAAAAGGEGADQGELCQEKASHTVEYLKIMLNNAVFRIQKTLNPDPSYFLTLSGKKIYYFIIIRFSH